MVFHRMVLLEFSIRHTVCYVKESRTSDALWSFCGCFLADFMKETSEELFQQTEVKNGNLVGIACVFVIPKLISVLFGVRGQVFLLHMANGGLMQICGYCGSNIRVMMLRMGMWVVLRNRKHSSFAMKNETVVVK
uniref:Uncharacterized protein n=1 Tax=Opuntia streptacantha TaxID=393608 RepID=A0A7C8YXR9_OPUST